MAGDGSTGPGDTPPSTCRCRSVQHATRVWTGHHAAFTVKLEIMRNKTHYCPRLPSSELAVVGI